MPIIETLIKTPGIDLSARDDFKQTALLLAVYYGNERAVDLLIKNGADLNQKGHFQLTPLKAAKLRGNQVIIEMLTLSGLDYNDQLR